MLAIDQLKEFPSPGRRLTTCLLSEFRRARRAATNTDCAILACSSKAAGGARTVSLGIFHEGWPSYIVDGLGKADPLFD
jgi:hypothetical protein